MDQRFRVLADFPEDRIWFPALTNQAAPNNQLQLRGILQILLDSEGTRTLKHTDTNTNKQINRI